PRRDSPPVALLGGPRERGAAGIAPTGVDPSRVVDDGVLRAQLLAGVEERRAAQREQDDRRDPGPVLRSSEATAVPMLVVVGQHPRRPRLSARERVLALEDALRPGARVPRLPQ